MHQSRSLYLSLFLIAATTFVCFYPVLEGNFTHWDDDVYVYANDRVRDGLSLENTLWAFQTFTIDNWHPLTWLSYMLDVELSGVSATQMHLTNLLLHIGNCVLLFLLLLRFFGTPAALVATLVFAIHPLHVEPVAWISQRKEVLSFFFLLLATHTYITYKQKNLRKHYIGSIIAFSCALMAKPMAVSFPVLIILLDYWPLNRWPDFRDIKQIKTYMLEKIPFVVLSAVTCLLTILAQSYALALTTSIGVSGQLFITTLAYVEYIKLFLYPANLAFFYPLPPYEIGMYFWLCLLSLIAVSFASIRWMKKFPHLFVAWWWYVIALLPVIGILKVGAQFVADRYTYVPFTGIVIALAYLFDKLSADKRFGYLLKAGSAAVLLLYSLISYNYARVWKDDISLSTAAIRQNADNPVAYFVLHEGVQSFVLQQLLETLSEDTQCVEGDVNVLVGFSQSSIDCLQEEATKSPLHNLLLAIHYLRVNENEVDESLLAAEATDDLRIRNSAILIAAVHQVRNNDLEKLPETIQQLDLLPDDGLRSLALFLCYYQQGDISLANTHVNEGLREFSI
ncbi:MAG: glycosyltransferase family 39 protein [Pseudomonadales bacterium]|nr:glycosyltransferase family 39 protein [Pseudomonadales bacterium]